MRGRTRLSAGCLAVLMRTVAFGGDATWNQTGAGTTYDWNNTGNWLPNTTFPNGAGETADMTIDIAGAQTIRLRQNITVGTLKLGDGAAPGYSMSLRNAGVETYTLTVDSGNSNTPAQVILNRCSTNYLGTPMSLNSDLLVDLDGLDTNEYGVIQFQGVMAMNGRTLTFTNGVYGRAQVNLDTASDFSGEGTVVNNSSSTITVTGKKSFGGNVVANGRATGSNASTFTLTGGGWTNAGEMIINGWVSNSNVRMGGGIHSGSATAFTNNPGQRLTRRCIRLNGGYLVAFGQVATTGTANDWQKGLEWVVDNVATMRFDTGYSYFSISRGGNTLGTMVNVTTLARNAGASVYLFGMHATNQNFLAANYADFLVGAGGEPGTTMMSMVPWMVVYVSGGFVNPAGFATYDTNTGFRALDPSTEYTNLLTAGPNHNVSVGSVTLASDAAVNALRYTGSSASNMGAGRTLRVKSGGVFFTANNGAIGAAGSSLAGTLDFSTAEGVIWSVANNANGIGARITGTDGVTLAGSGTLTLTGNNAYTGTTHVGGGILRVGDDTYGSRLGFGDVHVHAGATLWLSASSVDAIPDTAKLSIYRAGIWTARVHLEAGVEEKVGALELGGTLQPGGTYGSSASPATYKLDEYFSGSGVVSVPKVRQAGTIMLIR